MDKLRAMKMFVRVVEAGSFSAVARENATTQSAVSKQVVGLERALGARLLARTTRSLALTEEGQAYFAQARRLVDDVEEAESAVRAASHQLSGWLRIAGSVAFGRLVLLPIVQRFLAAHPLVKVDLRLADAFVDLTEQGIDVGIRIGELASSSMIARNVGTTRRLVLAHRDLVREMKRRGRAGVPQTPDDLHRHSCILYTELTTGSEWHFVAGPGADAPAGTRVAVVVNGSLRTNSSEVVRAGVLANLGIGYAPEWLFDEELRRGEVVALMPKWTPPPIPLHLVSPPARRHSAKVKAFGDLVAAAFAKRAT